MQQWICHIKGVDSVFGAREVERVGRQIDGVENLVIDFAGESLVLSAASRDVLKRLEIKLARLGYKVLDKGYSVRSVVEVDKLSNKTVQETIKKKIGAHTFVQNLDIRPLSGNVILLHSADFSISDFICDLNNESIKASLHSQQVGKSFWHKFSGISGFLSVVFFLAGIVFSLAINETYYSQIAYVLSIACSVPVLVLKAGRQFVLAKKFNYEFLLILLVGFLIFLGQWFEVALVGACVSFLQRRESALGSLLKKQWSKVRSNDPGVAFVKSANGRAAIACGELSAGHVINVQVGEIVPIDGVIISGEGRFSEKYLSGSSNVVRRASGATVFAGMSLVEGEVGIRLSGDQAKSMSSLLHRKLEGLQTKITDSQYKINRYAEYFLYATALMSVGTILSILVFDAGLPESWVDKSLALMLVAGSVFVVVSVQYSHLYSYLVAAGSGFYFFRPDYWSTLSGIDTVILDKNGVVTRDEPEVQEVISLSDHAIKDVLRIAASLSHAGDESRFFPVRERAEQHKIVLNDVLDIEVVKGKSISGKINGQYYRIGSQSSLEQVGLITPVIAQTLRRWQEEGANIILVADESRIFGLVTIVDPVRDEISEFIDCAHEKLGLKVVMLSHDNAGTSQVLANRYGFDDVVSEITDDGKEEAIESYTSTHSVLLISNRPHLVVNEKNRMSLVNDVINNQFMGGDKAIISLGVRLLPALNLIAMAKKINGRLKKLLVVVGLVKLMLIIGILTGFLSLGFVVGLEFLLGFGVLLSTYRPSDSQRD